MNSKNTLKYIVEKNSNIAQPSSHNGLPQRKIDGKIYKMSKHWKGDMGEYFYRLMELFDSNELYDNEGVLRYVAISDDTKQPRQLEKIFKSFIKTEIITPIKKQKWLKKNMH